MWPPTTRSRVWFPQPAGIQICFLGPLFGPCAANSTVVSHAAPPWTSAQASVLVVRPACRLACRSCVDIYRSPCVGTMLCLCMSVEVVWPPSFCSPKKRLWPRIYIDNTSLAWCLPFRKVSVTNIYENVQKTKDTGENTVLENITRMQSSLLCMKLRMHRIFLTKTLALVMDLVLESIT